MKKNKFILIVLIITLTGSSFVLGWWWNNEKTVQTNKTTDLPATGPLKIGKFQGHVVYDKEKDLYFLSLRGARFPFKTSPIQTQNVEVDAPGITDLARNTKLLYGMVGPEVMYSIILLNPDEEKELISGAGTLAQYIQIVSKQKYGGIAYTKNGGKIKESNIAKKQIMDINKDAARVKPIIQLKGPKSSAEQNKIHVQENGKIIIEGKTYKDINKSIDYINLTLLKMLCGSPDCPDASACATGGGCGCGSKS